jgi:hypothetical protein
MIGKGKTAEGILVTAAMLSERIGSATVYYNGQSITFGAGIGFDTQPYEDCMCVLNVGTVLGPLCTLSNSILESDTDDPTAASAVSGGSFDDVTTTSDEAIKRGAIVCRDTKRYLFLKTDVKGSPITVDFGAIWIGGKLREQPPEQVLEFDV